MSSALGKKRGEKKSKTQRPPFSEKKERKRARRRTIFQGIRRESELDVEPSLRE